ncbi:MAG TPA: hypothetical protein VEI57_01460 [Nitrospirota bacterium]|nr:hypothetical protein [Nitrospirota bacterium]
MLRKIYLNSICDRKQVANIEIANEQYLIRKMASVGAQDSLAEVTFTLTENPGIETCTSLPLPAIMPCRG